MIQAESEFPLTEDSKPQPSVPKGELIKGTYVAAPDSVFPGTEREYTIYLPHGFDRNQPLPFTIFQDGVIYQAPVVFDNLIAARAIPAMAGIFVRPGVVPATNDNALPRFNRSYEYDSVSNRYATFLFDELLPELEKRHQVKFSTNPNEAGIAGSSSGGIAAFVVAWHRPDRVRRVYTGVGTYVGLRGGDQLTTMVRKTEPKPLKIFLQDGSTDLNIYAGDWWMANQMMERSLQWSGYAVNHEWSDGGHNHKHATQVMPAALRWLWQDWQTNKEVKSNPEGKSQWKGYDVLPTDSTWTLVEGLKEIAALQVDPRGGIAPAETSSIRTRLHQGKPLPALPEGFANSNTTLSPDQTLLYVSRPNDSYVHAFQLSVEGALQHGQPYFKLHPWDVTGGGEVVAAGGMCVDVEGRLYVATAIGIQVFDQAGRVNFIIPTPGNTTDVCFAGPELSELHVVCDGKVYRRATKTKGVHSGENAPIKPAAPRL